MGGTEFSEAGVRTKADRLEDGPAGATVMYQQWEDLLFLHWPCDREMIQRTLPPGLTVDTFEGQAWVGVVPFKMQAVRPRFLPAVPGLSWFLELNVRTYVRDRLGRPGVWFYSLDCNQALACAVARRFFHLNYRDAEMRSVTSADGARDYRSRCLDVDAAARFEFRPATDAQPAPAREGSLDFFLVERYRLFAHEARKERLLSGRVSHEPYRVAACGVAALEVDELFISNGLPVPAGPPASILWSPGVRVRVHGVTHVL